jgi:DNA-binding phage protein
MRKSPIGREFAGIVQERAGRDPGFVAVLLEEAVECLLAGDVPTARSLIRDVIKGAIGYAELSRRTGTPEKSLVRMFGPAGNPTAANMASVLRELQRHGRVRLRVRSELIIGRSSERSPQRGARRVA